MRCARPGCGHKKSRHTQTSENVDAPRRCDDCDECLNFAPPCPQCEGSGFERAGPPNTICRECHGNGFVEPED